MISLVLPKFLTLPPDLRQRIYVAASFVVKRDIHITHHIREGICDDEEPILLASCALMLTCRTISEETFLLFYSSNKFSFRYTRPGDLHALHGLRPNLLLSLTHLTIQLNVAEVPPGRYGHAPDTYPERYSCPKSDDELLQFHSPSAQTLLSEWEVTANHLSRSIRPNSLDLTLVCDVADVETAQRVVAPLSGFPAVAACHI